MHNGSGMKLTFVLGTRPEVIKLAPVILEAKKRGHKTTIALTGQHAQLALPLLKFFGLRPSLDLKVMSANQSLTALSGRLMEKLDSVAGRLEGDFLLTQGDTTSAFIASYWAFCRRQKVAHVEAGLRTYRLDSPFPEEGNRQLISRLATLHFAPTQAARAALLRENADRSRICVTGNTAIDALAFTLQRLKEPARIEKKETLDPAVLRWISGRKLALVTAHRRESFGKPFDNLCRGLLAFLDSAPDVCAVYPVHPNPNVRKTVSRRLGKHPRILLVQPLPYVAFVTLMSKSSLIFTDSGGVQEEAPTLRKPILVLRDTSERPEGIEKGFARLVGTDARKIHQEGLRALRKGCEGRGKNPYGDGHAAARILDALQAFKA